jgi:hypothetical protein
MHFTFNDLVLLAYFFCRGLLLRLIEVVTVLQDLENVCGRVVCAPLEGAIADLRPLMSSSNQTVRNMTYMLILRYLKDNPNASADLLPDYLDCLDNRNAAVVTTALERLPDFLLLCQGDFCSKGFNGTFLILRIYL